MREYVEQRDGGYYLVDNRIGLDILVQRFKEGVSPEEILRRFPAARSLENVYGAITFYLANRDVVDESIEEAERRIEEWARAQPPLPEAMVERMRKYREAMGDKLKSGY